jgi:uncharacterized protein YndB with AHSA1/START domain
MPVTKPEEPISERELVLVREIDVPREKLYRCWTEPELLKPWFCPKPWRVTEAEMDVRPGGRSFVMMQGPEGETFPNHGVYLEVVPNEKIVFTDAFVDAWTPSTKAFMVGTVTFEDLGGGRTRYVARVQHWNAADRKAHEEMGFYIGWGVATDQLADFAKRV